MKLLKKLKKKIEKKIRRWTDEDEDDSFDVELLFGLDDLPEGADHMTILADQLMGGFSMVEWEPRNSDLAGSGLGSLCVRSVDPTILTDGTWTVTVEITSTYEDSGSLRLSLSEFLLQFQPTGPLSFRHLHS